MGSLRVWLQRSDDLLSTAWGTMDRYHLSWLMVGKPKDIVRGRPMTPDEEAAYVREVAEQKTAALRMSLDAVERQHMPFAGETGRRRDRAVPERRRTRGRGARGRRHPDRPGARPDRPRLPPPRAPARPAHPRARGRVLRAGRPQGAGRHGPAAGAGPPARRRGGAARPAPRRRSPTPQRRAWLDAQLVALETQAAALAGEPLPYLEHVARCFAFAPPRRDDAEFEAAAARIDELLPGDGPLDERLEAWDRGARDRRRPASRRHRLAGRPVPRPRRDPVRPARRRGPAGRRSSPASRGRATTGTTAVGARGSTSTPTCRSARRRSSRTVAHETYPGHHLEHAWKEADLVDGRRRLEASILLINTPECLISEGLADLGRVLRGPRRGRGRPARRAVRAGRARGRRRPRRRPRGRRAGRGAGRAPGRARGHPRERRDPAPRGRPVARRGPRLPADGRPLLRRRRPTKRLEFIEHPLWRTYVFVYAEGEALLRRWVDAVPAGDRPARFGRLLHEQLTPAAVTAPS